MSLPNRAHLLPVACCLLLILQGCGFHLRGSQSIDLTLPILFVTGSSELQREVERALKGSGATLAASDAEAEAVLRLLDESRDRRVLSVNSSGKVSEYALRYSIRFTVTDRAGGALLVPQEVSLTRDFVFDQEAVLAKGDEEARLFETMRREAIQSLLRRLQQLNTLTQKNRDQESRDEAQTGTAEAASE